MITLAEAKAHLRVDQDDEDTTIQLYIDAARDYIGKYINNSNYPATASVKAAGLLVIGDLYENREGAGEKVIIENPAVARLLHPYREGLGI